MELHEQLRLALSRCGYPPLAHPGDYRPIGAGAWHTAYLVRPQHPEPLVVRLRQPVIYGHKEVWNPAALHADYAPVGLYYQLANQCRPGVCPALYHYRVEHDLVYTLESYVAGHPLPLHDLAPSAAFGMGVLLGEFFRALHSRAASLPGRGLLTWGNNGVCTRWPDTWTELWQRRAVEVMHQADTVGRAGCGVSSAALQRLAMAAVTGLREEPAAMALVNRDITPENLLTQGECWVGLVDPVPLQESGTYYAAFFLHCYRLALPALSQAPWYARHCFPVHRATMTALTDGYETGYAQGSRAVRQRLRLAEWLWTLDLAYESDALLQDGLSVEMRMRRGTAAHVAATLEQCLQVLTNTTTGYG